MWGGQANYLKSFARSPYPRSTPESEFRRLAVYPGNNPAEPGNTLKIQKERAKQTPENLSEIWSGRVPGASGIDLEPSGYTSQPRKRNKVNKSRPPDDYAPGLGYPNHVIWGAGRDPEIDQKRARGRKSASGDDAGTVFLRFLAPLSFGVGLRSDFRRV